jgi:hypothetical protein
MIFYRTSLNNVYTEKCSENGNLTDFHMLSITEFYTLNLLRDLIKFILCLL